ncbi:MAG TPA: hypothetical protein VK130_09030 [Steroidobacteraceae bacterium]|nr:hypothetical protein [Steroidobacteraceae bacterium]
MTTANQNSGTAANGVVAKFAWLPIPLFLAAIIALWLVNPPRAYESPGLVLTLNLVFRTAAPFLIAYLAGRAFLAQGSPGFLLMGCAALFWAIAPAVAGILVARTANVGITISSLGLWIGALCMLASVSLLTRGFRIRQRTRWLLVSGVACVSLVAALIAATFAGWTPVFFIQGEGGTQVRHFVLGSAAAMLVLSALVLRSPQANRSIIVQALVQSRDAAWRDRSAGPRA